MICILPGKQYFNNSMDLGKQNPFIQSNPYFYSSEFSRISGNILGHNALHSKPNWHFQIRLSLKKKSSCALEIDLGPHSEQGTKNNNLYKKISLKKLGSHNNKDYINLQKQQCNSFSYAFVIFTFMFNTLLLFIPFLKQLGFFLLKSVNLHWVLSLLHHLWFWTYFYGFFSTIITKTSVSCSKWYWIVIFMIMFSNLNIFFIFACTRVPI